jgi:tetratricopeptide (TPR) repeat protein
MSSTDVKCEELADTVDGQVAVGPAGLDSNESGRRMERTWEALRLLEIAAGFRENGWPDKARRFAKRALAIFEHESGADLDFVRALLCLAGARSDLADYARAEQEYGRATDILDRLPDDPNNLEAQRLRLQTTRGLAYVTRALGREAQAEAMLKHTLALAGRTFGWKQAEVASVLNDLGVHYRHTGKYEKASRVHRLALGIVEEAFGPEDARTAPILHDLAILALARGQFAAGEPIARRAVSIREKTLGADHPQVAAGVVSIAALLEGQGRYEESELMYRRAIAMFGHWFGPDHPEVAITVNHLLRVFHCEIEERHANMPEAKRAAHDYWARDKIVERRSSKRVKVQSPTPALIFAGSRVIQ